MMYKFDKIRLYFYNKTNTKNLQYFLTQMDNTEFNCNDDGKITPFYLRGYTLKILEEKLSERVGEYHSKLIAPTYFDMFYSYYCDSGGLLNCGDIKAITGRAFERFYKNSKYLDLQDPNNIIYNAIKRKVERVLKR
jgi:hypothetical protein